MPVLHLHDGRAIPDSVDITYYLSGIYPSLIPASHRDKSKYLIEKLHQVSFFALTFETDLRSPDDLLQRIEKCMEGASGRYLEALQWKADW